MNGERSAGRSQDPQRQRGLVRHNSIAEHSQPVRSGDTVSPPDRKPHHPLHELGAQASSIVSWAGGNGSEGSFPPSNRGLVRAPSDVLTTASVNVTSEGVPPPDA